jgi:hypothetical protein
MGTKYIAEIGKYMLTSRRISIRPTGQWENDIQTNHYDLLD